MKIMRGAEGRHAPMGKHMVPSESTYSVRHHLLRTMMCENDLSLTETLAVGDIDRDQRREMAHSDVESLTSRTPRV